MIWITVVWWCNIVKLYWSFYIFVYAHQCGGNKDIYKYIYIYIYIVEIPASISPGMNMTWWGQPRGLHTRLAIIPNLHYHFISCVGYAILCNDITPLLKKTKYEYGTRLIKRPRNPIYSCCKRHLLARTTSRNHEYCSQNIIIVTIAISFFGMRIYINRSVIYINLT